MPESNDHGDSFLEAKNYERPTVAVNTFNTRIAGCAMNGNKPRCKVMTRRYHKARAAEIFSPVSPVDGERCE
jgi:hypothetical protein